MSTSMSMWCIYICSDVYEHMMKVRTTYSTRVPFEQQQKNANEHGYKWTELLRLPYFEPSRFVTIDPMHCLFLGTLYIITHQLQAHTYIYIHALPHAHTHSWRMYAHITTQAHVHVQLGADIYRYLCVLVRSRKELLVPYSRLLPGFFRLQGNACACSRFHVCPCMSMSICM